MLPEDRVILHVDDDADDRFLVDAAWRQAGVRHPLRAVSDGRQAIDYLFGTGEYADRARYPLPGLVLLDLKMPGLTGFDVLQRLRADKEIGGIPVLITTASTDPGDVAKAYRLGANGFFIKPSSAEELTALLSAIDRCWLRLTEFPAP